MPRLAKQPPSCRLPVNQTASQTAKSQLPSAVAITIKPVSGAVFLFPQPTSSCSSFFRTSPSEKFYNRDTCFRAFSLERVRLESVAP